MFNLTQQLTISLLAAKPAVVEGKSYLTLWVYQSADPDNKDVAGGEVMKLSAQPDLYPEFRALFKGATGPLVQCEITATLKTGAANSTKLYVTGVKPIKSTNSTAKAV